MAVLELSRLTIGFGPARPLASGLDLSIDAGQIVALVGRSGIGKTTLLRTIAGLLRPLDGQVLHGGRTDGRAARGEVGYVPQRLGLVHHATARQNVRLGALHRLAPWRRTLGWWGREMDAEVQAILTEVGLEGVVDVPVRALSGGQQSRVAVARTLIQRPRLLLADEFLGELDDDTAELVMQAVRRLAREDGCAVLLVEHHVHRAIMLADRLLELDSEQLIELRELEVEDE